MRTNRLKYNRDTNTLHDSHNITSKKGRRNLQCNLYYW